jgi:hypothetical protein
VNELLNDTMPYRDFCKSIAIIYNTEYSILEISPSKVVRKPSIAPGLAGTREALTPEVAVEPQKIFMQLHYDLGMSDVENYLTSTGNRFFSLF